jgi:hypothetical protein
MISQIIQDILGIYSNGFTITVNVVPNPVLPVMPSIPAQVRDLNTVIPEVVAVPEPEIPVPEIKLPQAANITKRGSTEKKLKWVDENGVLKISRNHLIRTTWSEVDELAKLDDPQLSNAIAAKVENKQKRVPLRAFIREIKAGNIKIPVPEIMPVESVQIETHVDKTFNLAELNQRENEAGYRLLKGTNIFYKKAGKVFNLKYGGAKVILAVVACKSYLKMSADELDMVLENRYKKDIGRIELIREFVKAYGSE